MNDIKGASIKTSHRSIGSNPTGQMGHPGKHRVVKNPSNDSIKAMGADSFSGNQAKPMGPVAGKA